MSTLTQAKGLRLVPPARPPAPAAVGDFVRVERPLPCFSGGRIPRGVYEVLAVRWGPDLPPPLTRPGWRLQIEVCYDNSALGAGFRCPPQNEIAAGAAVPIAAEPKRPYLDVGQYVRYNHDDGRRRAPAVTIPDHPLQND